MVRNTLMPQMQLYDAPSGPNVGNFINPLMAGLKRGDDMRQQEFANERALALEARQGEQLNLAKNADTRAGDAQRMAMQRAKVEQIAGLAQMADQEKDPNRRTAIMDQIYNRHPELVPHIEKYGVDPNDYAVVSKMLIAEARGFVDPLAEESKRAQIAQSRQATALSSAQLGQLKNQTPEARLQFAAQYPEILPPGSPQHFQFVQTGTYVPKDDTVTLNEGQTVAQKVRGPDGSLQYKTIVQGTQKTPPENITKTANFASRMIEAERNVRRLIDGIDPISGEKSNKFGATDWNATIGDALPDFIGNQIRSSEHQQYLQAAKQWIRAFLRKESGAAISDGEFVEDFRTYFPQPGNPDDLIKQKQAARAGAMKGFALEAGDYFIKQRPDLAQHLNLYGSTSPDTTIKTAPNPPAQQQQIPTVTSPEEAARLPRGTTFRTPNGQLKVVP